MEPRQYQVDCVDSLFAYLNSGEKGNPLIAMPTGSGKSLVIAMAIRKILDGNPNAKIIVTAHVRELLEQNAAAIKDYMDIDVGIYSAGLNKKEIKQITVASIQSIYRIADVFSDFSHMIVDESHLIPPSEDSMYRRFINASGIDTIIGLTATYFRLGSGYIFGQEDSLFSDVVYDLTSRDSFNSLVDQGYLAQLKTKVTINEYDTNGLHTVAGDFDLKEMSNRFDRSGITNACVSELIKQGVEYKKWLIFAIDIDHADHIAETLIRNNISAAVVHSKMDADRFSVIKKFKSGFYKAVVNVDILTTGFNVPDVDLIAIMRPTKSPVIHVQTIGRGARPFPGKDHCIASDSLVLTDQGLIPIQHITIEMKLWDGVEWVSHDGVVNRGEQEVIEYAGLIATEDHKVWTKEGWKTFGECRSSEVGIAVTGNGGQNIQQSIGIFRSSKGEWQVFCSNPMPTMWKNGSQGHNYRSESFGWVRNVWEKIRESYGKAILWNTKVDNVSLFSSKISLHESKRSTLCGLWREGNKIFILIAKGVRTVFNGNWIERASKALANRSNRQQWALRKGEHSFGDSQREYEQPKTKTQVWDITNAGSRNRFTCQGLLVSNCLVLDFSGNTERLGPINDIQIKKGKKGNGEPVTKRCPDCETVHHPSVRICPFCGYKFQFKTNLDPKAYGEEVIRLNSEKWYDVSKIIYSKYEKTNSPPMLKVSYVCGAQGLKQFNEYVCLEHSGYAGYKARHWVKYRGGASVKVDDVLQESLQEPKRIKVNTSKKYPMIVDFLF